MPVSPEYAIAELADAGRQQGLPVALSRRHGGKLQERWCVAHLAKAIKARHGVHVALSDLQREDSASGSDVTLYVDGEAHAVEVTEVMEAWRRRGAEDLCEPRLVNGDAAIDDHLGKFGAAWIVQAIRAKRERYSSSQRQVNLARVHLLLYVNLGDVPVEVLDEAARRSMDDVAAFASVWVLVSGGIRCLQPGIGPHQSLGWV